MTATLNLLVAARAAGVRRVVYAGSSSAYGDTPTLPKQEEMLPNPISPYAVAKLAGEQYMRAFARVYGLETVVLRYFNVFGPYQDPTSHYSGVLAIFCRKMLAGEQPTIYRRRRAEPRLHLYRQRRPCQSAGCSCPRGEGVGQDDEHSPPASRMTLNQSLKSAGINWISKDKPIYGPPRSGDIRDSLADICLAAELLGYQPIVDFREGLRRTVEWYRASAN